MAAVIKIIKEQNVDSIEELKDICWGQAIKILKEIDEAGLEDELLSFLSEISEDGTWDETQLNDLLAYDWKYVYEAIGMNEDDKEENFSKKENRLKALTRKDKEKLWHKQGELYMLPETGAVGTYEDWWYDELDEEGYETGNKVNAVDLEEVFEVFKDKNGEYHGIWDDDEVLAKDIDFACGGKKKKFNQNRDKLFEEKAYEKLSEKEISKILTPEEKVAVDNAHAEFRTGVQNNGLETWVADTKLDNGWWVRAVYYQPEEAFYREDGEPIEDLGELDWKIDHYEIFD